jgi:hypothetical protein
MAKGGCLFFLRARWRVSSELPSRGRGSSSNITSFFHPNIPAIYGNGALMFLYLLSAEWRCPGPLRGGDNCTLALGDCSRPVGGKELN